MWKTEQKLQVSENTPNKNSQKTLDVSANNAYTLLVSRKVLNEEQVIAVIRKEQGERSLRQFAQELGISPAYLSDVYRGNRAPGPAILGRLGLVRRTTTSTVYEKTA